MRDVAPKHVLDTIGNTSLVELRHVVSPGVGEEAIFAGPSSGAKVVASLRVAERLGPRATVVTIIVDSGLRYLTTEVCRT